MKSHWEALETIRVVDAGYLLAGLEPERKWQFAPPLVKNFFNLIRNKTGAVKMATMPGERMEITQDEFQALKAEYGVTPATEPTAAPVVTPAPTPVEQMDYEKPPEYQAEYARAEVALDRIPVVEREIREWENLRAATVTDKKDKDQNLALLKIELAELQAIVNPGQFKQQAPDPQAATVETVGALGELEKSGPVANWKMQIQAEATAHCLTLRQSGASPTRHSILDAMVRWCRDNDVKTDTKIYPSAGYLRTHVLGGKHWDVPN